MTRENENTVNAQASKSQLGKPGMGEQTENTESELTAVKDIDESQENTDKVSQENENQETEESEFERLKHENSDLKEKILRMAAENQNTRKRLVKQQQDSFKYRHQDILRDIADVIDNFERAIESSGDSQDFHNFHEGVIMIEKQFSSMLAEKYSLKKFGQEGDPFNPAAHEAVMLEESEEVDSQMVKQVFQAGYTLHERVLRPAKVVVVKPSEPKVQKDNE